MMKYLYRPYVLIAFVSTLVFVQHVIAVEKKACIRPVLPNGLYAVVRMSVKRENVESHKTSEKLLVNDFQFLDPSERQQTEYVVIQTKPFIPFIVSEARKHIDVEGKPKLLLQIAEKQAKPLEQFTRQHLGGKVAIVIGGKIVTVHKVREPIIGGRIQITRCTDHGCEALYTQIKQDM